MKTKNLLTFAMCLMVSVSFSQTDPYEGRSITAGVDVASPKDNVPVKKETFTAKLERYKKEGFKVAVILYSGKIATKAQVSGGAMGPQQIMLKGDMPSMENNFLPLVEGFTAKMNETFSTDIFEIVDLKKIPYRESKWGKVDNWEVTKYKMVLGYNITPLYDYTFMRGVDGTSKYSAELTVHLNATAGEYVNEKKGVKMKYIIRTGNLGHFESDSFVSETDPGIKTIEELHALVNPPMGADLLAELQKLQDKNMPEFIEKRKK